MEFSVKYNKTYAHAYFDAFRFPVKSGDSSARSLISVLTLSASPVTKKKRFVEYMEK